METHQVEKAGKTIENVGKMLIGCGIMRGYHSRTFPNVPDERHSTIVSQTKRI